MCLPVRPGMLMMMLDISDELLRSLWAPGEGERREGEKREGWEGGREGGRREEKREGGREEVRKRGRGREGGREREGEGKLVLLSNKLLTIAQSLISCYGRLSCYHSSQRPPW